MKLKLFAAFILLFLLMISLLSCSNDDKNKNQEDNGNKSEETSDKSKEETEESSIKFEQEVPEAPSNTKDLINYPLGKFAGANLLLGSQEQKRAKAYEALEKFPELSKNATDEEKEKYWEQLLYLFHEDYPDPQSVLKKLEMQSFGSPEIKDTKYQFKENLNVEVILDASGSMNGTINGVTKMKLAKKAISNFASSLPEGSNISLRVYGHKGTGDDGDKELSCNSSEIVYEMKDYNQSEFADSLNKFDPAGWTPIALALNQAKDDLSKFDGKTNTNIIYLVSDGINTCDGDPVQVAKSLGDSGIQPIVNVIGFDVDAKGQKQLREVADASKGAYSNVTNGAGLEEEFNTATEIAKKWKRWKDKSLTNLDIIKFNRKYMILAYENKWWQKSDVQFSNLHSGIDHLREEGLISSEGTKYFEKKISEERTLISKTQEEIASYLSSINEKTYKEMKKSIEEKYDHSQ